MEGNSKQWWQSARSSVLYSEVKYYCSFTNHKYGSVQKIDLAAKILNISVESQS